MRAIAIIPARYDSTRFKGKPLADLCGRPMLWWVYHQVKKARRLAEVWVATDHPAIQEACGAYQIPCKLTSPQCPTSTQRVWEAAQSLEGDVYVCVNGDEPLIDPQVIDQVVPSSTEGFFAANLMAPILSPVEAVDETNIKVVADETGRALFFSRSPRPAWTISSTSTWGCWPTPRRPWPFLTAPPGALWRLWRTSTSCGLSSTASGCK